MIQRLLLLCALVALTTSAYGLGLGNLELHSALNQQFDADISLSNVRGLETDEILPSLASPADFDRVGIERAYELTDLRFKVVADSNGDPMVKITSTKPIIEPYLNFIVEVLWPNGRILREYTVLLDPPVFGQEGVEQITAASSRPAANAAPGKSKMAASAAGAAKSTEKAPGRLAEGSAAGDEYGMTGPGDTLWAIAAKVRPNKSISVQQMMLALQRENPQAFINNNINLLKAGHVLRIPDMTEIRKETFASAVQEVKVQNEDFRAYRSGGKQVTQLDASRRQSGSPRSSGSSGDGELRLLASDNRSGDRAGTGGDGRAEELQNELSVAREDLDRARRASSELNVRAEDLQAQLDTLNEIVKLKDDQLAALRAEVQRMQAATPATSAPVVTPSGTDDSLLTNPLVLIGALVLLVGGAAGGLFFIRRRKKADTFTEEEFPLAALSDTDAEDQIQLAGPVEVEEEEEDVSPQTGDVISEAEIYIAYGRFPQAITFLQNAIDAEPGRADIQLKLLEVYVQTEDATAFNLQFDQLKSLGDTDAIREATALQSQIPGAAETAAAAMDATIVASEPIAAIEEPDLDDDDLSFDLDDLDSESEEDTLDLSDGLDLEGADDLDLDDAALGDDDLDLGLEADSADDEIDLGDDDIELNLDDEDDDTLVLDESPVSEDDDDLALDLDGGLELDDDDDDVIALDDLELGEDDDLEIDLESAGEALSLDDDDALELDLGDDDAIELDLGDDDDALELDLGDDDDALELNLDDDDDALDLSSLDTGDDDDALDLSSLDTGDDDELDISLDDELDLNLDEDAGTKLELARAYIDMGDSDGARTVLEEVLQEGDDTEVQEANELLAKID